VHHVLGSARIGQQHSELVSAQPGHGVRGPQRRLQSPAQLDQQFIARSVAQRVIDLLEAVEVHHQHRHPGVRVSPGLDRLLDATAKRGAVREPGQRVVQRLVIV
jgi:hypothetical protein